MRKNEAENRLCSKQRKRGETISVVYIVDTPNHIGGSKAIETLYLLLDDFLSHFSENKNGVS